MNYIPNWWFNPPTQNQINFASDIAKRLVYTLPKEYTKKHILILFQHI